MNEILKNIIRDGINVSVAYHGWTLSQEEQGDNIVALGKAADQLARGTGDKDIRLNLYALAIVCDSFGDAFRGLGFEWGDLYEEQIGEIDARVRNIWNAIGQPEDIEWPDYD